MNSPKSMLQKLLRSAGYDIRKTSHIGLDESADIQRIFGERALTTIFDVGAHLGESALNYAEKFRAATIYCFEPSPATFATLSKTVAGYDRIKAEHQAVGAKCQTQKFFLNKFSATNSLLPALPSVDNPEIGSLMENVDCVEVPVTTLDAFCDERHLDAIDLLKLDVQGFELEVLRGADRLLNGERVSLIYSEVTFETHYADQTTFLRLHAALSDAGFQLVDIYGQTRNPHHGIRWCDMLFVQPSALKKRLA